MVLSNTRDISKHSWLATTPGISNHSFTRIIGNQSCYAPTLGISNHASQVFLKAGLCIDVETWEKERYPKEFLYNSANLQNGWYLSHYFLKFSKNIQMFLLDTERTDKLTSKDLFAPKNHDRMLNFFLKCSSWEYSAPCPSTFSGQNPGLVCWRVFLFRIYIPALASFKRELTRAIFLHQSSSIHFLSLLSLTF